MDKKQVVVKIQTKDADPYVTVARVLKITVIDNNAQRDCVIENCEKLASKYSAFCYDHWYDFNYNPSKIRKKDGKLYSISKARKKRRKKNAK